MILILFATVFGATLIVPKLHLNHRLSYTNAPIIVNSSVNENTRPDDYFDLPDEFTYLTNSAFSLCTKGANQLYLCPGSSKAAVWKIEDLRREARFRDPYGNCITVGPHNLKDDRYEVILKECGDNDDTQTFIMYNDHGNNITSEISEKNIRTASEEEKTDFKQRYFKYRGD